MKQPGFTTSHACTHTHTHAHTRAHTHTAPRRFRSRKPGLCGVIGLKRMFSSQREKLFCFLVVGVVQKGQVHVQVQLRHEVGGTVIRATLRVKGTD